MLWLKHCDQKQQEESVCLAYTSTSHSLTRGSKGRGSRQELEQRTSLSVPPGLLSLLSDTAQDPIQGCVPPNPHELGLHSSHCLRKCWTDLPFLWRQFLNWRCFLKWYQLVSLRHKPNRVGNFNCFWRKINLIMCLLCLFSPFKYFWGLSFEDPLLVIVSFFFGTNTQV